MNEQVNKWEWGIWAIGILMWLLGYIMLLRQAFAKGGNWGWLMLIPPFLVIASPVFGIQF